MPTTADPLPREAAHRRTLRPLRLVTAVSGVIALGALYELYFGNVNICVGTSGWFIGAMFIAPLVFVALCTACSSVAVNEVEKTSWGVIAGLLALLYIYGAVGTLMSGTMGTLWC